METKLCDSGHKGYGNTDRSQDVIC